MAVNESKGKGRQRRRVLVLYYSQTGQLTTAVRSMTAPLAKDPGIDLVMENVAPVKPYPYPWSIMEFFSAFPESVHMVPPEIKEPGFDPDSRFDLVILAYQVWFLSPSLPVTGFLKSPSARVLKDTPVITLIVCRNMWLNAQRKVKAELQRLGARLLDNIALVDSSPTYTTFVTTPYWLLTGKKKSLWGIFPVPGVPEKDLLGAVRFGRAVREALDKGAPLTGPLLKGLGAVKVNASYIGGEKIAHRSFYIWGKLLLSLGAPERPLRRAVLVVYIVFLICMILTVMPVGIVVRSVLSLFLRKKLDAQVAELEGPSGSSTERMARYS